MADDAPLPVFARDDPAYLDRQRHRAFIEKERCRARKVDQIEADLCGPGIAELNGRRTPSGQRIEIGRNTLLPAIERRIRSEEECVFRVERSKRFCIEPAEAGRPFLDDGGYYFVSRALHWMTPSTGKWQACPCLTPCRLPLQTCRAARWSG